MTMPVSVVMAVYNGHRFLRAQVESILSQLEANDELIVVDDASTDDSIELLTSLNSSQIRVFQNTENQGVIRSFERGLQLAREEFIFLSDQDDIWLPGKRSAFEADTTHHAEILRLHDLSRDPEAGDMEAFRKRVANNFEIRNRRNSFD